MVQIKFVKEIPIINGTYKKDTPDKEIGYQKWRVRKTYEVEMEYEIGNINDEDFHSSRALLKQEVSAIITALDSK